jgi:hypothetical protein
MLSEKKIETLCAIFACFVVAVMVVCVIHWVAIAVAGYEAKFGSETEWTIDPNTSATITWEEPGAVYYFDLNSDPLKLGKMWLLFMRTSEGYKHISLHLDSKHKAEADAIMNQDTGHAWIDYSGETIDPRDLNTGE